MKFTSRLSFGLAAALLLTAGVQATILFKPVGRPPMVLTFNGVTMSEPVTNNPYTLVGSPRVYFIFVGPNWQQNGMPTTAVNSMIAGAKTILASSYLSGLKQYGSAGTATFGGFTIDTSLNPLNWTRDYTIQQGLCGSKKAQLFSSQFAPGGTQQPFAVEYPNYIGLNISVNHLVWPATIAGTLKL